MSASSALPTSVVIDGDSRLIRKGHSPVELGVVSQGGGRMGIALFAEDRTVRGVINGRQFAADNIACPASPGQRLQVRDSNGLIAAFTLGRVEGDSIQLLPS